MIQDIFPYKLNNQYKKVNASANDFVLVFDDTKILAKLEGQNLIFPTVSMFGINHEFIYLFSITEDNDACTASGNSFSEQKFFLLREKNVSLNGYEFIEVRQIRDSNIDFMYKVYVMMTGKHLNDWYRDTQFCGRCGGYTQHSLLERAMVCKDCGYTVYPRIMPAVIVGIINGEKLLLTKYRKGYANYALVAGFTEIGETIEQTVEREVMEEVGLKVKNIRYYKSQPWGLANDILTGFYCDVDGDTNIRMDENELKEASWVERKDIILQPTNLSLTNEMMMRFKNGDHC